MTCAHTHTHTHTHFFYIELWCEKNYFSINFLRLQIKKLYFINRNDAINFYIIIESSDDVLVFESKVNQSKEMYSRDSRSKKYFTLLSLRISVMAKQVKWNRASGSDYGSLYHTCRCIEICVLSREIKWPRYNVH